MITVCAKQRNHFAEHPNARETGGTFINDRTNLLRESIRVRPAGDQQLLEHLGGADRYVLTNQTGDDDTATYKALEISLRFETDRFLLFGGGAAGIAEGPAGSRGFGPIENDQATIGELGANPNAATFARGRFFTDRAFTGKLAMVIKLPSEMRLGLIARYQDGQPFARMLILTLNQGAEAVRAFANGDSRFTFVGTLDARFQKGFVFGDRTLTLLQSA